MSDCVFGVLVCPLERGCMCSFSGFLSSSLGRTRTLRTNMLGEKKLDTPN